MLPTMLTEQRLREVLGKIEGATVDIGRDGGKLLAFVVSPVYEGMDEGDRQAQAWGLLLDNLSDDEQSQVAFVYTNTPQERAEAERQAKASGS